MALLDAAYILAAVRSILYEPSASYWTDDQINKWVQEAAIDISTKTLGYEVQETITTSADTLESDEPSDCIKVHSCVANLSPGGGAGSATLTWGDNSTHDYANKTYDSLIYQPGADTNYSTLYNGIGCGGDANKINRSVIKFNIKTDLDALGATGITSAILKMYPYLVIGTHTVSAYRLLQNWVNSEVTWNSYSSGNLWGTAGCASASDAGGDGGSYDRKATAEASDASVTGLSYSLSLDLTTLAQKWLAGTAEEYGVLLQSNNESVNQYALIGQVESASENKPYLEVTYSYATAPSSYDYKGLSRIHPRLIQHVAHNETGEPIHYYHHHSKVGIWPLADDNYYINVYHSKVTDDITDLPNELRLLAIPYCLAMARLSEGWEDHFVMFVTMYLNGLMNQRLLKGEYKLNIIDSKDQFEIKNA